MWKALAFIVFLFGLQVNGCLAVSQQQEEDEAAAAALPELQTAFDDQLREFVEFLRLQMKCGFPAAGIPPLAPYQNKFLKYHYNSSDFSLTGNFTDFLVSGLDEFEVVHLQWNNVRSKLSFDFHFKEIVVHSPQYKMELMTKIFGPRLKIYGSGKFALELRNVHFNGSFRLKPLLGSGGLTTFAGTYHLQIESSQAKCTGIMNSVLYSKLFNQWLEEFINIAFNEETEMIDGFLEERLTPRLNRAFKNMTFVELVALILNIPGDIVPEQAIC